MPYRPETITELARRHGVRGIPVLMPATGMVNEAWAIGDTHVLRIVLQDGDSACDEEAAREALVVPLARGAGVRTPLLVGHGDAGPDHRPYTVYERASGELLGLSPLNTEAFDGLLMELGSELAKLHSIEVPEELRATLREPRPDEWEDLLATCVDRELLSTGEGEALRRWQTYLQDVTWLTPKECLCHNDVHAWNLLHVDGELSAILDWGDACYGDPAADFVGLPLRSMPTMFKGYEQGGGKVDQGLIARSLTRGTYMMLWELIDLDPHQFGRHWWRMPPGGWKELCVIVRETYPDFAP